MSFKYIVSRRAPKELVQTVRWQRCDMIRTHRRLPLRTLRSFVNWVQCHQQWLYGISGKEYILALPEDVGDWTKELLQSTCCSTSKLWLRRWQWSWVNSSLQIAVPEPLFQGGLIIFKQMKEVTKCDILGQIGSWIFFKGYFAQMA